MRCSALVKTWLADLDLICEMQRSHQIIQGVNKLLPEFRLHHSLGDDDIRIC